MADGASAEGASKSRTQDSVQPDRRAAQADRRGAQRSRSAVPRPRAAQPARCRALHARTVEKWSRRSYGLGWAGRSATCAIIADTNPGIAKLPFAIRLAPGKQQLVGNSMSARRRRCQSWTRKALLNYPQLFCGRPSTATTRVNNLKATDVASVSNISSSIPTISYRPANSTRRPTSDEYHCPQKER